MTQTTKLIDGDIDLVKYYFLSIVLLVVGSYLVGCSNPYAIEGDKQLYRYPRDEIHKRAQDLGLHENVNMRIGRNSEGTKIFVGGSQYKQGPGRVFVFSLGEEEPTIKDLPHAYNIWFDEEGSAIAWWIIGEQVVHLRYGDDLSGVSGASTSFQVDPSGRLAAAYDRPASQIKLYHLSANGAISVGLIDEWVGWLGRIYLDDNLTAYIESGSSSELIILEIDDGSYSIKRHIQLEGSIMAADIESGWLYLREDHDLGFGKRQLFNFKTGESRSLGRRGHGVPFFLKGDILGLDQ